MKSVLYDVPAPAKINLFLHVVGQRSDGYHMLQTVFRFVDLYDILDFELRTDGQIRLVNSEHLGWPEHEDLAIKAGMLLQKATSSNYGVNINIRKNIPAGAGLGGGSSNAASALIALNRLWDTGLNRDQLTELARSLGADVPVFVNGDSVFAQGTGDIFETVHLKPAYYVLVMPDASVNTTVAFKHNDLTRDTKLVKVSDFTDWQGPGYFGQNNLEAVAFKTQPNVYNTAQVLKGLGLNARMTGSGSCFFVESKSLDQARLIQQKISVKIKTRESVTSRVIRQTWLTEGLNEHPLKHWTSS